MGIWQASFWDLPRESDLPNEDPKIMLDGNLAIIIERWSEHILLYLKQHSRERDFQSVPQIFMTRT